MEVAKRDACDLCHKKPAINRKLMACKRCKRNACPDCSKDKVLTYLRGSGKAVSTTIQVCDFCRNEVAMLRKLKDTNKLKFASESKLGGRLMRMLSSASNEQMQQEYRQAHRQLKLHEKQQIHLRAKQLITEEKLYGRAQLSQPLYQLFCLVSADSREQQQNEKIKHLLMALAVNRPVQVLKCMAPLAIFMSMLLTEQQTYHTLTRLYRDFLPECFMLRREEEIEGLAATFKKEFENDRMVLPFCSNFNQYYAQAWRSFLANKTTPDVTLAVLEFVIQDKQSVIGNFNKALTTVIRAGMKASNADEDLPEQVMRADISNIKGFLVVKEQSPKKVESPEKTRKASQQLSTVQLMQENQSLRQENQRLRHVQQELVMQFRQKYMLILDSLHADQQALREHYGKSEAKLNQQKNQYIQKIVKLNDEIERLNGDLTRMRQCQKYYLQEIQLLQSRLSHAIKNKGDEHYESISPSSMVGDRVEKKKLLLGLMEALPTDFQPPVKVMSKQQVDQLEKDWVAHLKPKLSSKSSRRNSIHKEQQEYQMRRKPSRERLDSQTTRLLGILKKKDEKFVNEMFESNRIIQCYEQILWHMENKMELPDNDIARRVKNIINSRKTEQLTSSFLGGSHKKVKTKQDCSLF